MRLLSVSLLLISLTACAPAISDWDPLATEPQQPALPAGLDPNDAHALYTYGSSLLESSPRRAAVVFHRASRLDPTWADPFYARRVALLMADHGIFSEYMRGSPKLLRSPGIQKVDSLYRHALMLNPFLQQRHDVTAIKQALAWSIEQQIRRENPTATVNSLQLDFHIERMLYQSGPATVAWVAHSEGRFALAQENYRMALVQSKNRAYLHAGLARVLVLAGRFGEARDEMLLALKEMRETDQKKLVRIYESKALYEHSIGLILEQLKDQAGAREAYGRALQEDLSYYPSHLRLGELALSAGDTTTALAEFELAIQIRGDDAGIRYKYADLLLRAGRPEAAETEARRAIEVEPLFALSYLVLADAVHAQGKGVAAAAHYGEYLERASRTAQERPYVEGRLSELGAVTLEGGGAVRWRVRRSGVLAGILVLVGAGLGSAQESRPVRPRTVAEDLQLFSQVLNQIRVNHPDSLDTHRLFMAAVEGLVGAADPHSYVLPATRLSLEKERALREGKLVPVPIVFRYVGGAPVVLSVVPGSSAAALDIMRGDELVTIAGEPVLAESAEELAIVLAGPKGSEVTLRFERQRIDGSVVRLERVVKRESGGETSAVPIAIMRADGVGYVRVTTFDHPRVADDLQDALNRLERQGLEKLILDLRDNGGGLVREAAQVAGSFLPKEAIVYTSWGRKATLVDTVRVKRSFWKSERRYPIVVLVNHGTASASELVAGALQDHDRALIVGRPTFGKSLLMQGFPLTDGSLMFLTVGHVQTPCGRSIQREYRTVRQRDYYRASAEERELANRPSCNTAGGRTVYGGGGIYPDVLLPETPTPLWLARIREENLLLRWAGGYLEANAGSFTTAEALAADPTLPGAALSLFRDFAEQQGVRIPTTAEEELQLRNALVLWIAGMKWGPQGLYHMAAVLDPEVEAAAREFGKAAEVLVAR